MQTGNKCRIIDNCQFKNFFHIHITGIQRSYCCNFQGLNLQCNRSKGNNMTQTKEDLKQRRKSYGQYKREQILKPKLQEKRKEIRKKYIANLSDQDILEALHSKKLEDGWTDLKREARKRGIL